MPTIIIEHSILDASAWAKRAAVEAALRAARGIDDVSTYEAAGRACAVIRIDSVDAAAAYMSESGLAAAAEAGMIGPPTIQILEAVAVASLAADTIKVDRLWPRGKGPG